MCHLTFFVCMPNSYQSLPVLCRVSRQFSRLATPFLYKSISLSAKVVSILSDWNTAVSRYCYQENVNMSCTRHQSKRATGFTAHGWASLQDTLTRYSPIGRLEIPISTSDPTMFESTMAQRQAMYRRSSHQS